VTKPALPGAANTWWKRRIVALTHKYSVGVAVGVHGKLIYEHDGNRPRVPASNEKLLLTMALFDRLGASYRIATRAESTAPVIGGVLKGDLWLIGGGDPTLSDHQRSYWGNDLDATTLRSLARRVARSGVKRIMGSVMGGNAFFSHDLDAPGWRSFVPYSYVEPLTSVSVNGNNAIRHHPELKAAGVFTNELEKAGVKVDGKEGAGTPPRSPDRVARVRSETLEALVRFTDKNSNNFFAEMFGKLLGARTYGPPGTIKKGARAIEEWAKRNGARVVAYDSSGLSYKNKVSPNTIVSLLGVAENQPWLGALRGDLPSAGEGTLRYRLPGVTVKAKTGTLFYGASALSGWVRSHGRWIEFSILDNKTPKTVEDKIVRTIGDASVGGPPSPRKACSASG
jgi:D-alanyl-D-alanine carboxypeptidase/D-alanyl-D-alanine-endopeptidase (penicillin-binding protein 4)